MPDGQPTFRHKTDAHFWSYFQQLPSEVQALALKNYDLLKEDARHPSLQFKKVGKLWSVRVGLNHRGLGHPCPGGFYLDLDWPT